MREFCKCSDRAELGLSWCQYPPAPFVSYSENMHYSRTNAVRRYKCRYKQYANFYSSSYVYRRSETLLLVGGDWRVRRILDAIYAPLTTFI